jgi:hypothetical protein
MTLLATFVSAGFWLWFLFPVWITRWRFAAVCAIQVQTIGKQGNNQYQDLNDGLGSRRQLFVITNDGLCFFDSGLNVNVINLHPVSLCCWQSHYSTGFKTDFFRSVAADIALNFFTHPRPWIQCVNGI